MGKARKSEEQTEAPRYGEAVAEIERILESIDRDQIDIDELSAKVERAVSLIRMCQEKLRATEARVTQVLEDLHQDLGKPEREAASALPEEQPSPEDGSDRAPDQEDLPF